MQPDQPQATTITLSPAHSGLRGAIAGLPIMLGYLPIAFSFGVAAVRSGLSVQEATFLSVIIYSGAAQFVSLILLAGGAPLGIAILTLLAMNVRHLLYAPALLAASGKHRSTRFAWLWSFGLTDEVFAASIHALTRKAMRFSEHWMTGIGAAAYLTWIAGTILGALLGSGLLQDWPAVDAALGFMLPALFLALLLSIANRTQAPVIAIAGLTCAGLSWLVSPTLGVLSGMLAGAIAGVFSAKPEAKA